MNNKLGSGRRNLSNVYAETKRKERYPFARALRDADFTRSECRSYGFDISTDLWKSCMTIAGERSKGGMFSLKSLIF